ncbi:MAG: hypothetical protein ACKVIN_09555 [Longimicrobiales bacterium]
MANLEELQCDGTQPRGDPDDARASCCDRRPRFVDERCQLRLPEISSAAWSAAQSSEAGPYLDYDWVIQVARAYESHEI